MYMYVANDRGGFIEELKDSWIYVCCGMKNV
jgi:hypothetical protein